MADTVEMESGGESNVLFRTYGDMVDSYFSESAEAGEAIVVIPSHRAALTEQFDSSAELTRDFFQHAAESEPDQEAAVATKPAKKTSPTVKPGAGEEVANHGLQHDLVLRHLPKDAVQKTQEMVDSFRRILGKRKGAGVAIGHDKHGEEEQLLFSYLKEFRAALKKGEEEHLETNPFYELTKQVYKLSLDGVSNAFQAIYKKSIVPLPQPINVSRSLKEIWRGAASARKGWFEKVSETFGKFMAFCRTPLSLMLFIGSTYTTARGVNDILQMDDVARFFGNAFDGSEGEGNRYAVCLASGLILSSAILDYKTRVFQCIVESGGVMTGIKDAFLRNPRWMVLASFLAVVSIKTNYDGIVSIISKKEDLAQQSALITSRVRKALGSPFFMNALEPDSLFDLQASFQQTTREIRSLFRVLPEDEVKGVASSGDPRKGPRYWAKHFIVHGGYEAGINDVTLAYNNHVFARKIDDMLKNSGIDFSSSFSEKVELLRAGYEAHLKATDDLVHKHLSELNIMMSMDEYSMKEIKRVLALEHYQINDIVQIIVAALEENKQIYKETSEDLSELTNTYLGILQMVDKSGVTGSSAYQIQVDVTVPRIEAIDQLREGKIPIAKHKNFEELRAALMYKYGISLGGMLLLAILFFSISMDFGDPIVFSLMTARRGKKDRMLYKDRLHKYKMWEEECFAKAELFFQQPEVQAIYIDSQDPGETMVRNAFYKLLEEVNPELKDDSDKTRYQRFDHWFQGMFHFSRTAEMAGLNKRLETISKILRKRDRYFPRWGLLIYPHFQVDKAFQRTTFKEWHETSQTLLNERRVSFYQELRDATKSQPVLSELPKDLSPAQKRLTRWVDDKGLNAISKGLAWWRRTWFALFKSTPKEPIAGFGYTRRSWLEDFSENSMESEKIIESIYGFIPDLKKVVFETLPSIQGEYLEPVLDFLNRYPGYESTNELLNREQLQKQFDEIEKEALDLWGVSFFASDDPGGFLGLSSIIGQEELSNLQEVVERTGTDSVVFSKKVNKLATDMERAHILVTTTEEMNNLLTDVRTLCVGINQSLMKIKMRAWEYRRGSTAKEGSNQFLDTAKDLQFRAPQEADGILSVMEAILQSSQPYTNSNLQTLRSLKEQASELHDRIIAFVEFDPNEADEFDVEPYYSPTYSEPESQSRVVTAPEPTAASAFDAEPDPVAEFEPTSAYEQEIPVAAPTMPQQPVAEYRPDPQPMGSEPQIPDFLEDDYQEPAQSVVETPIVDNRSLRQPMKMEPGMVFGSINAERKEERAKQKVKAVYESSRGAVFEGLTGSVGRSNLDFISSTDPAMLPIGNEGTIQLTIGMEEHTFPSKVVRVFDNCIAVRILSDKERFASLFS